MLNFARHRRLRHTANLRAMVRETRLHKEDLIYPIFVVEGENQKIQCNRCREFFKFHWTC